MMIQLSTKDKRIIELPDDLHGLLAWRCWRSKETNSGYRLFSIIQEYLWTSSIQEVKSVDAYPVKDRFYGIDESFGYHARCLNDLHDTVLQFSDVSGAVELRGKYYAHENDVLRTQWIRILFLVLNSNRADVRIKDRSKEEVRQLKDFYQVPVYVSTWENMRYITNALKQYGIYHKNNFYIGEEHEYISPSAERRGYTY